MFTVQVETMRDSDAVMEVLIAYNIDFTASSDGLNFCSAEYRFKEIITNMGLKVGYIDFSIQAPVHWAVALN